MAVRKRGNSYQVDVKVKGQRIRVAEWNYSRALLLEEEIKHALKTRGVWLGKKNSLYPESTLNNALSFTTRTRWKSAPYLGEELKNRASVVVDELGTDTLLSAVTPELLEKVNIRDCFLAPFRAVMEDALNCGAIESNPVTFSDDTAKVRMIYNVPGYGEEFERLMLSFLKEWESGKRAYYAISLMLETGIRVSEISYIARESRQTMDILCVHGKYARRLPITENAQCILNRVCGIDKELLCGLNRRVFFHWWYKIQSFFGLRGVGNMSPSLLRNTVAYKLRVKGVSANTIQKYMGAKEPLNRVLRAE